MHIGQLENLNNGHTRYRPCNQRPQKHSWPEEGKSTLSLTWISYATRHAFQHDFPVVWHAAVPTSLQRMFYSYPS